MNPEKEIFTRSDILQKLGIQSYILSLWEKEFAIATINAADGQVLYTFQGYSQLKKIKELIYEKGYNLDSAKKSIAENKVDTPVIAASPLPFESKKAVKTVAIDETLKQNLRALHKQLLKLRKLL